MMSEGSTTGAVLVVGAGITGIQAALDAADSGYKVYLVEKSPHVGGRMTQLDKTFPTNDCSMCIMSPKVVELDRNRNIEILTLSELINVEGEPGNFKAAVKASPRRIDPEKCTHCKLCEMVCPVETPSEYEGGLAQRKAIYSSYPQAVPAAVSIDRREPPCNYACPLHLDAREYVELIRAGRYEEAWHVIRSKLPFPGTLGRICPHPCEDACSRSEGAGEAVSVCALKRFVSDKSVEEDWDYIPEKKQAEVSKKIAVIGSGPSGLTAAHDLACMGHKVKVYEALPTPGGMLTVGIPKFRLPREVIEREINAIENLGVTIQTDTALGRDITLKSLKEEGYDAVYLALGAHKPVEFACEGFELEGVMPALDFLRTAALSGPPELGKQVAVIGGGDTAVDAARTAKRMGSDVTIYYRRSNRELRAHPEEIQAARDEGIKFRFLTAPVAYKGKDGRVDRMVMVRMKLLERDAEGRRRVAAAEDTEYEVPVDNVLTALGQKPAIPDDADMGRLLDPKRRDRIKIKNEASCQTEIPWIFAGGDAATGPRTAVEAIAAGSRAAEAINAYLCDEEALPEYVPELIMDAPVICGDDSDNGPTRVFPVERSGKDRCRDLEEYISCFTCEQAQSEAERCLSCRQCIGCGLCVEVCETDAISFDDTASVRKLDVGSIILAPGHELFDISLKPQLGGGRFKNVVTHLQFERMISASGPNNSLVLRPSDGVIPEKVAWLMCVGSREKGRDFCSAACCMASIKEAVIAKEHMPFIKPTFFYLDFRAFGKGYERYYERAKADPDFRFKRCMISRIEEIKETGNLKIKYFDESGELQEEEFDMAVLAAGMNVSDSVKQLAASLNVKLDEHGFCSCKGIDRVSTSRPGVYVCGTFENPKDIPDSIIQAGAAADKATSLLTDSRFTQTDEMEFPPERDVESEEPRVGVFICRCGLNIAGTVDTDAVVEYAKTLDGVAYVEECVFACSRDSQKNMRDKIEEHNLNRIIVSSCSPRTHEAIFQENIRKAGLNPYLFQMANIRDQCSWVHPHEHDAATKKAKLLTAAAVADVRKTRPLTEGSLPVTKRALIIGGGPAGMHAALEMAGQGFDTVLVEKKDRLGGNLAGKRENIEGVDLKEYLQNIIETVMNNPRIKVMTGAKAVGFSGMKGRFSTILRNQDGEETEVEHGIVILATGAVEHKPKEYNYGESPRILTQGDLERSMDKGEIIPQQIKEVVMIQCVEARTPERPYCGRVCCTTALKNALILKRLNPNMRIRILFRDMRAYGKLEKHYSRARESGILFHRYEPENKPVVTVGDDNLRVTFSDLTLNEGITVNPDMVVLSTPMVPDDSSEISTLFAQPLTQDQFFMEAHVKLRPVESPVEGVYICGAAHFPKLTDETATQAAAAVSAACRVLAQDKLKISGIISQVDPLKCAACLHCVRHCPYSVPKINKDGVSEIEPALCRGCGLCAAECPQSAIQLLHYTDDQINARVDAMKERITGVGN